MSHALDEDLLDDVQQLALRDGSDLLLSLAGAGALVRRAQAASPEWDLDSLRAAAVPRAILVATDEPGAALVEVLAILGADAAPVLGWTRPQLPRWCGSSDALLVGTADGDRPWLAELVAAAGRRGMAIAVAAPADSPVASAGRMARAAVAETPGDLAPRAATWGLLTPLLIALDALGAASISAALLMQVADALDDIATECRPSAESMTNPAKLLAVELGESRPAIGGAGSLGAAAARWFAVRLALLAGEPAVCGGLPHDAAAIAAAIERDDSTAQVDADAEDVDDFFRDRVEDPALRPRLVLTTIPDVAEPPTSMDPGMLAEATLVGAARVNDVRVSAAPGQGGPPLARFAAVAAFADFTAAYLAFARGMDPGALRATDLADLRGRR